MSINNIYLKAANYLVPQGKSEEENEPISSASKTELTTLFSFTPDEESLVFTILQYNHLWTSSLTLYEILGVDLKDQLETFGSWIDPSDYKSLKADFTFKWFALLIQEKQDPQELIEFLNSLVGKYVRSHFNVKKAPSDPQELKSFNDTHSRQCKEMISELSKRTSLLIRLLGDSTKIESVLKKPVNETFQADQKWVSESISDIALFFKNISKYVEFIYSCSVSIDPSLKEYSERVNQFNSQFRSLGVKLEDHSKNDLIPLTLALSQDLESKAPYLCMVLLRAVGDSLPKMESFQDLLQNMQSAKIEEILQTGLISTNVDDLVELENDKLVFFKKNHLIPASFVLTNDEDKLLDTLFNEYPLDSDLTLHDLLSFALYDQIEKLKELIGSDKRAFIDIIQKEIGALSILLFFGMLRSDPGLTKLLGPADTDDALYFSRTPSKFLEQLAMNLALLAQCGPQINGNHSSKVGSLIRTRQKEFQSKLSEMIFPIEKLWTKILKSDFHLLLLYRSLNRYVGAQSLDQERSNSFDTFVNFVKFQKSIISYASGKGYFHNHIDFNKIPAIGKNPSKKTIQLYKKNISELLVELQSAKICFSEALNNAKSNTLSQTDTYSTSKIPKNLKKNQSRFIESIFSNVADVTYSSAILTDHLRIFEKKCCPKDMPTITSSFYHLVNSVFLFFNTQKTSYSALFSTDEVDLVLKPSKTFLGSDSFRPVIEFIKTDAAVINDTFIYASWLVLLNPLGATLKEHLDKTLYDLARLPKKLKGHLKQALSKLSLEELKKVDAKEIREQFFQIGLQFVLPIGILIDGLVLLQKINFDKEALRIPPELANLMDPDGIEYLLQDVISSKTIVPTVESQKVEVKAPMEQVVPTKPNVPQKVEVKEEKFTSSLFQDIVDLTKSEKILKLLEKNGFYKVRQTGSHNIMTNASNITVPVPNNNNLPIGTRRSIAKIATQKE